MTEKEKMIAGKLFETTDPQLSGDRLQAAGLVQQLNGLAMHSDGYREILDALIPHSPGCLIRPPFHCDYGYNLYIGTDGFINFNCVMLDGAPIRIGNHVLIGPAVQIYTFTHPMDYRERRKEIEQCKPITIGDDCWIGGGTIILPGVTLGERVVVGAGSVVTKSFPADTVIAGNPARVIRQLDF